MSHEADRKDKFSATVSVLLTSECSFAKTPRDAFDLARSNSSSECARHAILCGRDLSANPMMWKSLRIESCQSHGFQPEVGPTSLGY